MTTTVRTGDGRTTQAKSVAEALKAVMKGGVEAIGPSQEVVSLVHSVFDVRFNVQQLAKPQHEGGKKYSHLVVTTVGGKNHEIKQLAIDFDEAMSIVGQAAKSLGESKIPETAKAARKKKNGGSKS